MQTHTHHSKPFFRLAFATALLGAAAVTSAAPIYSVTALGSNSYASDINDAGQVVGTLDGLSDPYGNPASHAFLYSAGTMTDLGTLGGRNSSASAINNNGQVVGSSGTGITTHAFLYSAGTMTDLGVRTNSSSSASGINDTGQVVGSAVFTNRGQQHAFLYSDGTMTDLLSTPADSSSYATGINNSGQVVVRATVSYFGVPRQRAFLYSAGTMTDLGDLGYGGVTTNDINNAGQVVGYAATRLNEISAGNTVYAYLYSAGKMTILTPLDTLSGYSGYYGNKSIANGINDAGQVVGQTTTLGRTDPMFSDMHAFLYSGGEMKDLNDLVDPASGWTITDARDINASGDIAAYGCKPGFGCQALLLDSYTPPTNNVSEPTSLALMGLSLAGLAAGTRRRRQAKV